MKRSSNILVLLAIVAVGVPTAIVATRSLQAPPLGTPAILPHRAVPPSAIVEAVDFLPAGFPTDGSADGTVFLQRAFDAAAGRVLMLPPFPVLVSRRPGQPWCLRIRGAIELRGAPGSVLRERVGKSIVLYAESLERLRLSSFAIEGPGTQGAGLGHGLLQVNLCKDVRVEDVTVRGSDADGIAIAGCEDVRLSGCRAVACSKAGLYVNASRRVVVSENLVSGSGGHMVPGSGPVGAAIQLSSNRELVCSGNVLEGGTGIGILCNALPGAAEPDGCVLVGNRIRGFRNAANLGVSCGIRCENASAERDTHLLVASNSVRDCGIYGIYVEHHDGAAVVGNTLAESEWSGILVSAANDVFLEGNLVLNSDTALAPGKAPIHLLNGASRVVARDNGSWSSPAYAAGAAQSGVIDTSGGVANDLEPLVRNALLPPAAGSWPRGSVTWNAQPASGQPLGWVCTQGGSPGTWVSFGSLP